MQRTFKRPVRTLRAAALAVAAGLGLASAHAEDTAALPALAPELFPGIEKLDRGEALLRGLAVRFPGRIFEGALPALAEGPGEPVVREPTPGVRYLRAGSARAAVEALSTGLPTDALVLDLRRCTSTIGDAHALATLLSGRPVTLRSAGEVPPAPEPAETTTPAERPKARIILTGPATSGPLEAALQTLAASGDIVTVGAATAGRTGFFTERTEFPGWSFLSGEVLAADGTSLIGIGARPLIEVADPAADAAAYDALTAGASLEDVTRPATGKRRFGESELLRLRSRPTAAAAPGAETDAAATEAREVPVDTALQRALGIVSALEALGKIPAQARPSP